MQQNNPTEDTPLTHVERPHFGTRVVYSLKPGMLLKEEFTSGVLTQSETIPYGAVWDAYRIRPADRRFVAAAGAAAALLVLPISTIAASVAALGALWLLFHAREVWTVFDYDGRWLVTCKGAPTKSFRAFLKAFSALTAKHRHPVQQTFESLDLEDFSWTSALTRWECVCRYDRIILKKTGVFGRSRRYFYSLPALRPPIRLVWRHKFAAAAAGVASWAAGTAVLWFVSKPADMQHILRWGWIPTAALLPAILSTALILRLAVHFQVDDQSVLTPSLPWWQIRKRRRLLTWLSRMVDLGQRIDELDWDHYWDYHRRKLYLLKEEGLLDDWPYHSAMTRLNADEREQLGD